MPIRILPSEVAKRIAAGEVVERPASVAKELIENALDAGATRVAVEANGGGLVLLRVSDNGSGLAEGELELAFQRHATSKLPLDDDLNAVTTLGFRGEALPSVAAVADVEAVSRTGAEDAGFFVRLEQGGIVERGHCPAPVGTTISVRGLFRRLPARLKFLRSLSAEAGAVATVVTHYALAYPEVGFSLQVDGRETFATSGSGDRREAVSGVYGASVAAAMLGVSDGDGLERLEALISPPSLSRASRSYITVFINRRWVRSRSLTFAVEEAYRGLLPAGRFPLAVIDLRVPPEEVDVNVHPAKAEVRLRNERAVFALVQRPLRRALSGMAPASFSPNATWPRTLPPLPVGEAADKAADVGQGMALLPDEGASSQGDLRLRVPILRPLGQAGTTYIIAEGPVGLYLIDQHAAHERVLFERVRTGSLGASVSSQGLLAPVALKLTPAQEALVSVLRRELEAHGFEVEPFGGRGRGKTDGWLLRATPADVRGWDTDPEQAFLDLLELIGREDGPADPLDRVAASIACHGSVRAGQALSLEEMRDLLRQLEECELPQTCPHGRPTMLHLTAEELARRFGRR
jgi:DNA mismatch repair protein MutL